MFVRSVTGPEAPGPGQPSPVPGRWHLRTQVSRKTLFDLIQDTLPPGGAPFSGDVVPLSPEDTDEAAQGPPSLGNGVLPQAYLDPNASTVPISLNPAALWNDGDTTPDIPQHWRPITITLASTALTPQPQLPVLPPPAPPPHPLHGVLKSAGWMLAGVALTFLVSAAAFGGRPLLQAVHAVLARPQAQAATVVAVPAGTSPAPAKPSQAAALSPADEPAGRAVVAVGDLAEVKVHRVPADPPRAKNPENPENPDGEQVESDASKALGSTTPAAASDRRDAAASGRAAHRSRQERRTGRTSALPTADSPLGEDAVLPLDSAAPGAHPAAARPTPTAIAKTAPARTFRPIDVEDPFAGR